MEATDGDIGQNSRLTYRLQKVRFVFFQLLFVTLPRPPVSAFIYHFLSFALPQRTRCHLSPFGGKGQECEREGAKGLGVLYLEIIDSFEFAGVLLPLPEGNSLNYGSSVTGSGTRPRRRGK